MPELNPLTNEQIFLKKIAENTGSNYNTGDVSEINPLTIDQILLKEIAANTAGQSGDITELEEKVSATQDMLSDAYDSTQTYNVGDYCIHEDVLYKCNTASTTGTWDSSKWDVVTVAGEIGELTDAVNRGSVSVTADGVKTYTQLFNDLYALATYSRIYNNRTTAKLIINNNILQLTFLRNYDESVDFAYATITGGKPEITHGQLHLTNSVFNVYSNDTHTDYSATVPAVGTFAIVF